MIPLRSIAIFIISFFWLFISIVQWVFNYPDTSNLLFAIGFFLVGLYVAYDQAYKARIITGMRDDIETLSKISIDNEYRINQLNNKHNKKW